MGEILQRRREQATKRLSELASKLDKAKQKITGKACVYLTGSFARGEASVFSDLDLFIAGLGKKEARELSQLDEIVVQAELIDASRQLGFPDFSGDGEYLAQLTIDELVKTLGTPEDDATNTFTARLLLLLESKPLLDDGVYQRAIDDVISAYWRDYGDHKGDFAPAYLANDILRLWRTFCVNYEARTQTEPDTKKAKRKLKNYKLKHSRILTCFSALSYLLAVYTEHGAVSPVDARAMVHLSPTERIQTLPQLGDFGDAQRIVAEIIAQYEHFLTMTDAAEDELIKQFLDGTKGKDLQASSYKLGDLTYELIQLVGSKRENNRLQRLLLV